MKNILFIITLIILQSNFCFAQQKFDVERIEKENSAIVDSVLKYYVDAFVNEFTKSGKLEEVKEAKVDQEWKSAIPSKFDKDFSSFIIKKIQKPVWNETTWQKINDYVKDRLTILSHKYELYPSEKVDSLKAEIAMLKAEVEAKSKQIQQSFKTPTSKESNWFDWIKDNWILLSIIALMVIIICWLISKINGGEDEEVSVSDRKIQKLQSENSQLSSQLNTYKNKYKLLEADVEKLKSQSQTKVSQKPTVVESQPKVVAKSESAKVYEYLCQVNSNNEGGYFKRVQDKYDSSSFYRMYDKRDGKAKFEFNGDEARALANWSSILESVSEYSGDPESSRRITTEEPGVVQYDVANERWKVVKKAKLKLS